MLVLSSHSKNLSLFRYVGHIVYIKQKRRGPYTEPCGTPKEILRRPELEPFKLAHFSRVESYEIFDGPKHNPLRHSAPF